MLVLVSGASGVGKSAVRRALAPRLGPMFEAVELRDLGPTDTVTVEWRQDMAEVAAARAAKLAGSGRHLLLCGDPVAAGEVIAAPSAPSAGGIAVCVLDATPEVQTARLAGRGDDLQHLAAHHGFAQWMREHAADPTSRLEVLTSGGSARMQWERLSIAADHDLWRVTVLETSGLDVSAATDAVHAWIDAVLADDRLVMHPERWTTAAPDTAARGDR